MRRPTIQIAVLSSVAALFLAGCRQGKNDPNAGAPPPLKVERAQDPNVFQVDHPDQFPLTVAIKHDATSQLTATATVNPDVSRTVPVISLADGPRRGDQCAPGRHGKKGQVLLRGAKRGYFRRFFRLPKGRGR